MAVNQCLLTLGTQQAGVACLCAMILEPDLTVLIMICQPRILLPELVTPSV